LAGVFCSCSEEKKRPVLDAETLRQVLAVPHFRNPLAATIVERWTQRDLVFEKVRFQGRYGDWIPALVVYSQMALSRPLPVILCMPGSPNVKEDLLQPMDLLPRWADKGFFVVSIDRPYHGGREGDLNQALKEKGIVKVWGEYVYDLMRTIDYLETRSEADVDRLGMVGLSMGGMEALLMGALDDRVDAVVSIAGQLDWQEIFAAGSWKTIFRGLDLRHRLVRLEASAEDARAAFEQKYPGLAIVDATIVAPLLHGKPLLLVVGENDPYIPLAAARNTYLSAEPVYKLQDVADHLELWEVPAVGHSFTRAMQERALAWFIHWL
jgi:pimeloyl-ACP methyl ester carboxylesterase